MAREGRLKIGPKLALPLEAVTQTFAIIAKRGVGKTYLALVVVEELLKADQAVVVVDPVGVCWGLRAAADGKSEGLPIIVLGGEHGDLPLEPGAGETIADLVVDERLSVVLDLSAFRKAEQVRFMTAFAERPYHRNREPLHIVLDEADMFAPQKPMGQQTPRMLGAVEDLVRRGRARGLGLTLVTQRAAVLNKDVLTQCEVLITLRTIAPQDRAAIDAWVKVHGTPEKREELMSSLPSLPVGTAWFWRPGWLDLFRKVKVRERDTYDSSATPKVGAKKKARAPRKLAAVDLDRLRKHLDSAIARAKAEDPKLLRRRILELERELTKKSKTRTPEPKVEIERVEVAVIKDAQIKRLETVASRFASVGERLADVGGQALGFGQELVEAIRSASGNGREPAPRVRPPVATPKPKPSKTPGRTADLDLAVEISNPMQRILNALAWLESVRVERAQKTQLALLAEQSPTSSGYTNNLGRLRSDGLITYPAPGHVCLTDDGRSLAEAPAAALTTAELHDALFARLPARRARILRALIDVYPDDLGKDELAERAEQSPTSSGYTNNLGALRSLGFIDYLTPGRVSALPVLFLE